MYQKKIREACYVGKQGDMMRSGLDRVVEWLRPFVDSKAWDYCVVWKLGDDPSRFIQWVDCCCGGGSNLECVDVKRAETELGPFCRDVHLKHPVSTKACEALAQLPSFMPLYSGIHGEVVISTEPRWLIHGSKPSPELFGTQVLIPVFGGLIELFTEKQVAKDEKIMESIRAHCHIHRLIKQETTIAHGYSYLGFNNEHCIDPLLEENVQNLQPPCRSLSLIPRMQCLVPLTQPGNNNPSLEGSSSGSSRSNEHPSCVSYGYQLLENGDLELSIGKSSGSRNYKHQENILKEQGSLLPDSNKKVKKVSRRSERDDYKSKNLVTERNRRTRIKNGLFALRALVPKISKMDKAAILGDAIDYIGELKNEMEKLQDELKSAKEEEVQMNNMELKTSKTYAFLEGSNPLPSNKLNQDSPGIGEKKRMKVQLEVTQIGKRDFLLKILCEQKRGGFGRLMDAIHALGLQILDFNVTALNGTVLNILRVEVDKEVQPKKLRDSLVELTGHVDS